MKKQKEKERQEVGCIDVLFFPLAPIALLFALLARGMGKLAGDE